MFWRVCAATGAPDSWIELKYNLRHEPMRQTRNRKMLLGLVPPGEQVEPAWELRIGEYRVFYHVDEAASIVSIRRFDATCPIKQQRKHYFPFRALRAFGLIV